MIGDESDISIIAATKVAIIRFVVDKMLTSIP
jgi:hypothetical protein